MQRLRVAFICVFAYLLLPSCGSSGPVTVLQVCGDIDDTDVDAVRVFITGTRSTDELLSVVTRPEVDASNVPLPTVLEIPRLEGPGLLSVEARARGRIVARYTHRVPELAELESANFPLDEACRMFDCPFAETCIDGECVNVRPPQETVCR